MELFVGFFVTNTILIIGVEALLCGFEWPKLGKFITLFFIFLIASVLQTLLQLYLDKKRQTTNKDTTTQ